MDGIENPSPMYHSQSFENKITDSNFHSRTSLAEIQSFQFFHHISQFSLEEAFSCHFQSTSLLHLIQPIRPFHGLSHSNSLRESFEILFYLLRTFLKKINIGYLKSFLIINLLLTRLVTTLTGGSKRLSSYLLSLSFFLGL